MTMLATLLTASLLLRPTISGLLCANTTTNGTRTTCPTFYPSSLQIMNSLYPNSTYAPTQFFMLARQLPNTLEVAMQVQFSGLPPNTTNTSCRLELEIPSPDFSKVLGPQPIFDIYAVEREVGVPANWETYEGHKNGSTPVFGTVDGGETALEKAREGNGTMAVGEMMCNETLTFQMAMKFFGGQQVNYWEFVDVAPPAMPVQGWRIVNPC